MAQTPEPSIVFGSSDAFDPDLAGTREHLVVGWTEDDGYQIGVRVSTPEASGLGLAGHQLGEGNGIRLAAQPDGALAVWRSFGEVPQVLMVTLDATGTPVSEPQTLSEAAVIAGFPTAVSFGTGYLVAWTQASDVRVVELDATGGVLRETRFFGGNQRPTGPENPTSHESDRAWPTLYRPVINASTDTIEVFWLGMFWESDDVGGDSWYRHEVSWSDPEGEPEPLGNLPVWASIADLAELAGATTAIQTYHNPNGGPWELSLRFLDAAAALRPFTSETTGPLRPKTLATTTGLTVAWASPMYGGIAVIELDAEGNPSPILVRPSLAGSGEIGVALGQFASDVWLAWVDRQDGHSVIRIATASGGDPATPVPLPVPFLPVFAAERAHVDKLAVERLSETGPTLLAWLGSSDQVHALWVDDTGQGDGPILDLTPDDPRCSQPSLASYDGSVLAAYHCCTNRSICSESTVRISILSPGAELRTFDLPSEEHQYRYPLLAVDGNHVGLAMTRGDYSQQRGVFREVTIESLDDLVGSLTAEPDIEIPTPSGDHVYAIDALWMGQRALIAVLDQGGSRQNAELQLVEIVDSVVETRLALTDGSSGMWDEHRMAMTPSGIALVGPGNGERAGSTVLSWLSDDLGEVVGQTVIGRGLAPQHGSLSIDEDGLAVTWYNAGTDGNFVAFVDFAGVVVMGPIRFDDPAVRASRGDPHIVPLGDGQWRAFYRDPTTLLTAPFSTTEP